MNIDDFKFDVGGVVTGESESYISRNEKLQELTDDIFKQIIKGKQVNFCIEGINRIGKTSLVREMCRQFNEEGHSNTLVIFSSLSDVTVSPNGTGFWPFWRGQVIDRIFDEDEIDGIDMEEIHRKDEKKYSKILEIRDYFNNEEKMERLSIEGNNEHEIANKKLRKLFQYLFKCEQYILLIIDEFDRAREVFGEDGEFFNHLRGLLNGERNALSVVTISRRSLFCIEEDATKRGSSLHGIFTPFRLFGFTNQELEQYFELLNEHGCNLSDDQKADVVYYCGRSPYYLAIMGNAILKQKRKGLSLPDMKISQLFAYNPTQYYESFERIVQILHDENLYDSMLQLFVGPRYDLDEDKKAKLVDYGYCERKQKPSDEEHDENDDYKDMYHTYEEEFSYRTICNSFIDYLAIRKKQDVRNIFSKLLDAEERLRAMVLNHMRGKSSYGRKDLVRDILFNGLLKSNEKRQKQLQQYLERYRSQCEEANNSITMDASILNVISIFELGVVIKEDWNDYKEILTVSMKEFEKGIALMNKVRNPFAHGNGKTVPHDEILAVRNFSEKICDMLKDV